MVKPSRKSIQAESEVGMGSRENAVAGIERGDGTLGWVMGREAAPPHIPIPQGVNPTDIIGWDPAGSWVTRNPAGLGHAIGRNDAGEWAYSLADQRFGGQVEEGSMTVGMEAPTSGQSGHGPPARRPSEGHSHGFDVPQPSRDERTHRRERTECPMDQGGAEGFGHRSTGGGQDSKRRRH